MGTDSVNILHLLPTQNWAGTEEICAGLANYQANMKAHHVTVVQRAGGAFDEAYYRSKLDCDVRLIVLPASCRAVSEQARFVDGKLEGKPDVIHAHLGPGARLAQELSSWYSSSVLVGHLHIRFFSSQFWGFDSVFAVSEWQLRDIPVDFAGRVFLAPDFLRTPSALDGHRKQERIEHFRSSINLEEKSFVIGTSGRLHYDKGIDLLIEAFQIAALPESHLVLIGDGPLRKQFEELANGNERIHFVGYVDNPRDILPCFDLYVSSSRAESFGLSVLEAATEGIPILATEVLGTKDMLSNQPASLVSVDDAVALSKGLVRMFNEKRKRCEYDLSAYDSDRTNRIVLQAYSELSET